jgi:hypothetical protein
MRIVGVAAGLSIAVAASVFGFAGVAYGFPRLTVAQGNGTYGDPAAAAQFWRRQHPIPTARRWRWPMWSAR